MKCTYLGIGHHGKFYDFCQGEVLLHSLRETQEPRLKWLYQAHYRVKDSTKAIRMPNQHCPECYPTARVTRMHPPPSVPYHLFSQTHARASRRGIMVATGTSAR